MKLLKKISRYNIVLLVTVLVGCFLPGVYKPDLKVLAEFTRYLKQNDLVLYSQGNEYDPITGKTKCLCSKTRLLAINSSGLFSVAQGDQKSVVKRGWPCGKAERDIATVDGLVSAVSISEDNRYLAMMMGSTLKVQKLVDDKKILKLSSTSNSSFYWSRSNDKLFFLDKNRQLCRLKMRDGKIDIIYSHPVSTFCYSSHSNKEIFYVVSCHKYPKHTTFTQFIYGSPRCLRTLGIYQLNGNTLTREREVLLRCTSICYYPSIASSPDGLYLLIPVCYRTSGAITMFGWLVYSVDNGKMTPIVQNKHLTNQMLFLPKGYSTTNPHHQE